jgi:hypothetical protein
MSGMGVTKNGELLARALLYSLVLCLVCACGRQQPDSANGAAAHPSFNGLWSIANADLTVKPGDDASNLTDETQRRIKAYAGNDGVTVESPEKYCMPHGMPWIMVSRARDYLIDIYQTTERVTMLFEGMDVHRLIRLDQTSVPESYSPGTNGYSLAHWEGSTLVIETSSLRPTNELGRFHRSEQMRITERWRLIEHPKYGRALEAQITVVDPVIFRKPDHGYQLFIPAGPGAVLNAYGCNESAWDDHVVDVQNRHD